jgi:autotransporter-associated beta strand protein
MMRLIERVPGFRTGCAAALLAATLCLGSVTQTFALSYWDVNGANPGATDDPSGAAPGVWDSSTPNWNESPDGIGTTRVWDGLGAVFSAGGNAFGTFTVTVVGTQEVSDVHFDDGTVTLAEGELRLTGGLISVAPERTAIINSIVSGEAGLTKYKMGTLVLGGQNVYAGETWIEGGTLRLGASNRLPPNTTLVLHNGDERADDGFVNTPATFHTGGFDQTLGLLVVSGPNRNIARTIDFGSGAGALVFADSSGADWNDIPLHIVNFNLQNASLRFGTDAGGLTAEQLALIRFVDFGNVPGQINSEGFVTPLLPDVPEILSVTHDGSGNVTLTWTSIPGRSYRVEYKPDLNAAAWTGLQEVTAQGETTQFTDTPEADQRYYRVGLITD